VGALRDPGPRGAEPLGLHLRPQQLPGVGAGLRALRLEFSSRGDRVPARLILPAPEQAPVPLVLLGHGADDAREAAAVEAAMVSWARTGTAVLCVDLPLHGERRHEKLTERLRTGGANPATAAPEAALLWAELVEQAAADLARSLDAAAGLPELDAGRIAYAGLGPGAILAPPFLARDSRPRAAALALAGSAMGPAGPDPAPRIAEFAPRPVLLVDASPDEAAPRRAAEALHAAAGEPRRMARIRAKHAELPERALDALWDFLRGELLR